MIDVRRVLRELGIVDVRDEGDRIWAPCPFHGEVVNSFVGGNRVVVDQRWLARFKGGQEAGTWFIRPKGARRGQHHCFACGKGGPLQLLVGHVLDVGWRSVEEWLARWEGADEPAAPLPSVVRFELVGVAEFRMPVGVVWGQPLSEWLTPYRRYGEKRGITAAQVERWAIGYCPEGRLEGRIVIPVHGTDDVISGYMARAIDPKADRRYLFPSSSDFPDLDVVFGERCWPEVWLRGDRTVVVTEGAINALAVERAGVPYVGALGSSHVRPLHVAKLATFGKVVVLTDPDLAGDKAAEELKAALSTVSSVRVRLPPRADAASLPSEVLRAWISPFLSTRSRE